MHALQEGRRVLRPRGILIDLRPMSVDVPLEIVSEEGCESAGIMDMSPGIESDIQADNAVQTVVGSGDFKELSLETFTLAYYWKTVEDMKADVDDLWKDDVNLRDEVAQQARILFSRHPDSRVRIRIRRRLARLEKQ